MLLSKEFRQMQDDEERARQQERQAGTILGTGVDVAGTSATMAKPQAGVMMQDMLNQVKENQRIAAAEKACTVIALLILYNISHHGCL